MKLKFSRTPRGAASTVLSGGALTAGVCGDLALAGTSPGGTLREVLDWLRDHLAPLYEEHAHAFFKDAWAARDGYIDVILDRSPENVLSFLS